MSKKILCKFFAHGACLKGEHCEFSHDWRDQANNICTFYQKGACSYGSRCRYEHVKLSRQQTPQPPPPPSLNSRNREPSRSSCNREAAGSSQLLSPVSSVAGKGMHISGISLAMSTPSRPFHPTESTWVQGHSPSAVFEDENGPDLTPVAPADHPICSFAAAGNCPYGDMCPKIHGDLCSICGKHCLHPSRPDERDEHIRLCQKNKKHLEALRHSQDIECSVCLDRILLKPKAAERKFGLLSECDHPFCVSCIRNWRNNSPESGMDVNSALRACPICRKLSYFVIPSVIWYSSKEEKQEIIDSYKTKLRSIDCRHFNFGNGSCPFGTSCFYQHAYRDGRLEEVVLRHLDSEDGNTVIAKEIRLSDFFRSLQL